MRRSVGRETSACARVRLVLSALALIAACGGPDEDVPAADVPAAEVPAADAPAAEVPATEVRSADATAASCVIGADAVGPVRLGTTLDEARRAFPEAVFTRSTDGDGAALVTVTRADTALMTLYANEDDADDPIDWSRPITFIETFAPACRTASGIGPGSLVVDVERTFGPTKSIVLSEIESRQFIEFERQPAGMVLRLDYSGVFAPGARETVRFEPGAMLWSVTLTRSP